MRWTFTASDSCNEKSVILWSTRRELRPALDEIENEVRRHMPELMLYLERTADRRSRHLWVLPLHGIEWLLEVYPEDCLVRLAGLKLPEESPESCAHWIQPI